MLEAEKEIATKEIQRTIKLSVICARPLFINFMSDEDSGVRNTLYFLIFIAHVLSVIASTSAIVAYPVTLIMTGNNNLVDEIVPCIHVVGYIIMGLSKTIMLWYKKDVFKQLLRDMMEIWPVPEENEEVTEIKRKTWTTLRFNQVWYILSNGGAAMFYHLLPIVIYIFKSIQGKPYHLSHSWRYMYPFESSGPVRSVAVYFFEMYTAVYTVYGMLSSDMLFMAMSRNIALLLKVLKIKIRKLASEESTQPIDCYAEIVKVVKVHQQLISFSNEIEEAFTVINLFNVIISSINICCALFVSSLLEPWLEPSSKCYFLAALSQMGIICWYADDMYRTSQNVSDAAYESGWYKADARSRRALLLLIQRSHKPLVFTALKFGRMTLMTYTSILMRSYSYFTVLFAAYRRL